jgi:hypothetical protein
MYLDICFGRTGHLQAFTTFIICLVLNLFIGQCLHSGSCQIVLPATQHPLSAKKLALLRQQAAVTRSA